MEKRFTPPTCYIVAGPNGAGKTTFALRYLPRIVSCFNFLNADEIARGVSPIDSSLGLLDASKIFLAQLKQKLKERRDFAFETTLSGRRYLTRIPEWQSEGWQIVLLYLYIPNSAFSAKRVHERVIQGGHNIPMEDILRCYPRSLHNLFDYAELCDRTFCFDNSKEEPIPVFERRRGQDFIIFDDGIFQKIQEVLQNE